MPSGFAKPDTFPSSTKSLQKKRSGDRTIKAAENGTSLIVAQEQRRSDLP